MGTEELIGEVRELVGQAGRLSHAAAEEVARQAEGLRARIEEGMLGGDAEVLGLLNEAVVAMVLWARAVERADEVRADEYGEQARLFVAAAEQAVAS